MFAAPLDARKPVELKRTVGKALCLLVACLASIAPPEVRAQEQHAAPDSLWHVKLPDVVVTATRSEKTLRDVPIPTQVISQADIASRGAVRLSDVLASQAGLALVEDLGTGVQLQGLDPAYTMILIDGEPVIGRSGGTLDLTRLTTADLARIEIVQGPSSSLYGSEALAGVINLITRKPQEKFSGTADIRYETHETMDVSATAELSRPRIGVRLLANRYSSSGYDLFPDLVGLTVPGFTDYTTSARITYRPSSHTDVNVDARLSASTQRGKSGLFLDGTLLEFDENSGRTDWSVAPRVAHRFSPTVDVTTRLYLARFATNSELQNLTLPESTVGTTNFNQLYGKGETQMNAVIGARQLLSLGGGYVSERVAADRVRGDHRSSNNLYGFAQHEWMPAALLDVIVSARVDMHSEYTAHLSPKAAVLVRPSSNVRIRASAGSGFKRPTFQQQFMDFTNPAAGYSVIGATDVAAALAEMDELGQIRTYLADPATIATIRPETAVSFNLGVEAEPGRQITVRVGLFRNNVRDLIDTIPVATKSNGQNVFTYVNLNRIYTQGVNADVTLSIGDNLSASFGGQFLDAKDRDVVDELEAGTIYKRVDGRDRRVSPGEYGGLFNRSRLSGTIHIRYEQPALGLTASLQGIVRGRYGFRDLNGNLILDDPTEYVGGYSLWNALVAKDLSHTISATVGVKNALGYTNPVQIPSLSGRLLYAGFRLGFKH